MSILRRACQFTVCCMPLLVVACSEAPTSRTGALPRYPVRGKLLVNGKPAKGAQIRFHPVNSEWSTELLPGAFVEEDGSFVLKSGGSNAGAPAGEYAVTVLWQVGDGPRPLVPDKLKNRYVDPKKPVCTVVVEEGETVLEPINIETELSTEKPPPPDDVPEKKPNEQKDK